jgi:DNA invertase Pin-like site-specific DNA recombinase
MKKNFTSEWMRRHFLPGKASNYIGYAETDLRPGDKVVVAARVSGRTQKRSRNLNNAVAALIAKAERLGCDVVSVQRKVASGKDSIWLAPAVGKAQEYGAKILAETTDRLKRHQDYHSVKCPDARITEWDLQMLALETEGVRMVTLLHPDATPKEVRSYQRKRGQAQKGKKGGRPKVTPPGEMVARRKRHKEEIIKLNAAGHGSREIARRLNVPESTVRRWVRHFCRPAKDEEPQ